MCGIVGIILNGVCFDMYFHIGKESFWGCSWNRVYYVETLPGGDKVLLRTEHFCHPTLKYARAFVKEDIFYILREAHLA
jgi:hypothetical protein